jgi:cytochrome c oxidase subunit 4
MKQVDISHDEPNYMAVFYALFFLTVVEVGIAYTSLPKLIMVGSLIILALVKAALVAMYFMHLRFEKRTLAVVAVTPAVLLVMFLGIIYPDAAWRLFAGH